jgi:hypothetical protein
MPFVEFLVRIQNVFQLLAFVSNVFRLPWPQAPPDNRASSSIAMP